VPIDPSYVTNPPSTLIDVIGQVVDAFKVFGDATPIKVGKNYLDQGPGSSPRAIFVPDSAGRVGPPREMGNAASVSHGCTVYVRAKESGDDLTRFRQAYKLADIVIDLIGTAATGRIEWGTYADGSPTDVDAYGAEIVLSFSFRRDVLHYSRRWPDGIPADALIDATVIPQNGD